MIQPTKERYLDEILGIEKIVFEKLCTQNQLMNDLTIRVNVENWVYLEDQRVIGYILGWIVCDKFHLNNIAVHTDFQRKHIGRTLIEHVCSPLENQNIQRLNLEVSEKAQQLYESMGFQQKSLRRDYYAKGDHAFLYQLDLIDNG